MTDPPAAAQAAPFSSPHLHAIDELRGVAILAVIVFHLGTVIVYPGWITLSTFLHVPWIRGGWMGVNLFFILSGFVLYLPYAEGRRALRGTSDALAFLRHRAQRLVPLYVVSTALLFVLGYKTMGPDAWKQALALATLTFNFSTETFFPKPNWVLWSLGLEFWFSLAFPLVVACFIRFGFASVVVVVFVVAFAVRVLGTYVEAVQIPSQYLNPLRDSLPGRLDDFVVGMLLAKWHAGGGSKAPLRVPAFVGLLLVGIAVATIAPFMWELSAQHRLTPAGLIAASNNVFQLGATLVIVAMLGRPRSAGAWLLLPLELAGMMCYSLYVWHGVVMNAVITTVSLRSLAAYAFALAIVGWLSYRYIEFGRVRNWRELLPRP